MEIGTMSAEELALSFSNQNQQTQQQQPPVEKLGDNFRTFEAASTDKSASELAEDFKNSVQKPIEKEGGEAKTTEELAEEAKVAEETSKKTKLDDSFKQGLDKLFKEQKLNPYSDGTETGYLVPETFEDVLELIEENKKSWVEGAKAKDREELVNEVLATKSPAWQFLIQNSEKYQDPAELIPLLTAVQNQDYSASLDPTVEEDQIKIIRAALTIQGLAPQAIEDDIADLKERGKQGSRAEALKPILDNYNAKETQKVLAAKQAEDAKAEQFWNLHYKNLEDTVFKSKDIDGIKLKNEHKQLIASALIQNTEEGGLPIYTIIDKLVTSGNMKLLSKAVLLLQDEALFDSYFLTKKADTKAEGIQKVLRQTGTSFTSSESDNQEVKPIKKSSYGYFG
jgi:hypothetical protein